MTNPCIYIYDSTDHVKTDLKGKKIVDKEATREYKNRGILSNREIDTMLREADLIENEYFRLRVKALVSLVKKFGKRRAEVSEGEVYFSSWQGDAYCLKADTGEKVWNQSGIMGWSRSGPSVADGRVYFGGLIYCLDASNGEELWHYSQGDIHAASSPIVAGEYAYFGASGGYENTCTYCVKAATGEYIWKSTPYFSGSPAVVDGVLYVGGDSIVAFSDSLRIPTPVLIMAFTVVAICTVVALAYVANREGKAPSAGWKRVFTAPVTVLS